ncbi:MAG: DUF1385 domain-containing protein [Christensenellales bacterium]
MEKQIIGGQAVMEGVMMRSPQGMAVVVRKGKDLALRRMTSATATGWKARPFIRGIVNLIAMLKLSSETLNASLEMMGVEEEPGKFEKWLSGKMGKSANDIVMAAATVLGIGMAVVLFFLLPGLLGGLFQRWISSPVLIGLIEGGFRLLIFTGYMLAVGTMKDMKRFFGYHGAEHRVVNCYEADLPLTVENARRQRNANPRCGTSFLLLVMIVSILIFSLVTWPGQTAWMRLLLRLALLPAVTSVSYEALFFLAKYENGLIRALRAPGMVLQRLTTRDPDDGMLEVALAAFVAVLRPEERAVRVPADYRLPDEPSPEPEETVSVSPENGAAEKEKETSAPEGAGADGSGKAEERREPAGEAVRS